MTLSETAIDLIKIMDEAILSLERGVTSDALIENMRQTLVVAREVLKDTTRQSNAAIFFVEVDRNGSLHIKASAGIINYVKAGLDTDGNRNYLRLTLPETVFKIEN